MTRKYRVSKLYIDSLLDNEIGLLIKKSKLPYCRSGDDIVFECRYRDLPTEFIYAYLHVDTVADFGEYWLLGYDSILYNEYDCDMNLIFSARYLQ